MKIKTLNTASIALIASILSAGLIGAAHNANATGNVLLPSNDPDSDNKLPNLGLVPQTRTQPQTPATATTSDAQTSKQPAIAPPPSPAATVTVVPPPQGAPTISTENSSAAAALLSKLAPGKQTSLATVQPPTVTKSGTTTIIKTTSPPSMQSLPQMILQLNKNMSPLSVNISNKSIWGPSDIVNISNKLGIDRKQVPETCILSLRGTVLSSGSMGSFNTGTKGSDETYYNGKINNTYAQVFALCPASTPVPSGRGIINQIDDKYVIHLATGGCSPSQPSPPSQLTILYAGNGQAGCAYQ